jgi:hypothetical protein
MFSNHDLSWNPQQPLAEPYGSTEPQLRNTGLRDVVTQVPGQVLGINIRRGNKDYTRSRQILQPYCIRFSLDHNFSNFLEYISSLSVWTVWRWVPIALWLWRYRRLVAVYVVLYLYRPLNGSIHRPKNSIKYLKKYRFFNWNRPTRGDKVCVFLE